MITAEALIRQFPETEQAAAAALLSGKTEQSLSLLHDFLRHFRDCGPIELHAAKTMIGISNGQRRIAWIIGLGKQFVDVVFPFKVPYQDNFCFRKIAQVPGGPDQYNHHLRLLHQEDINDEVQQFMRLSLEI